jgi:hypothetical protein
MKHPDGKAAGNRRHAARLRETAATAPAGGPLQERLLQLASQYDQMAEQTLRDAAR